MRAKMILRLCFLLQMLLLVPTIHAFGAGLSKSGASGPGGADSSSEGQSMDSAHGTPPSGSNSGPVSSGSGDPGTYNTLYPPPELTQRLNIAAFEKAKGRSSYGQPGKYCAAGVREALNALFGKNVSSGPPAKGYNESVLSKWRTANSCFKPTADSGNSFQNFDIRVLQPKSSAEFGHIEIFYKGRWYSDFTQDASLWGGGNGKYKSKSLYRLSPCQAQALLRNLMEWVAGCLVSSAHAQSKNTDQPKNESRPPRLIAEAMDSKNVKWTVKDVAWGEGTQYVLYKLNSGKEIGVLANLNSIYSLIYSIEDKELQMKLASDALGKWIATDGKAEVQKHILSSEALTEVQRETYLQAGFQLPKDYIIYKPAPSTKPGL